MNRIDMILKEEKRRAKERFYDGEISQKEYERLVDYAEAGAEDAGEAIQEMRLEDD